MPQMFFCRWCRHGYAWVNELPAVCPGCDAAAEWLTEPEAWPFRLSVNDRQFLKSIRVATV